MKKYIPIFLISLSGVLCLRLIIPLADFWMGLWISLVVAALVLGSYELGFYAAQEKK